MTVVCVMLEMPLDVVMLEAALDVVFKFFTLLALDS